MDGSSSRPYAAALVALDRRIERELLRLRARYQLSFDEFHGLYVSDEHVDSLVASTNPSAIGGETGFRGPLVGGSAVGTRFSRVTSLFALSNVEQDLLFLAFALETDLKYEKLYAYLNDDVARKWPTLDLARRLLGSGGDNDIAACAAALAPEATLRAQGLIDELEPSGAQPSRLNSGFALCAPLARFLMGIPLTPPDALASLQDPAKAWSGLPFSMALIEHMQGIARMFRIRKADAPIVVMRGERGSGRLQAARAIANALGLPLRQVDLGDKSPAASPVTAMENLGLEARLEPAAVCVHNLDAQCDHEGHVSSHARDLFNRGGLGETVVFLLTEHSTPWRDMLGSRRALIIELDQPDFSQRVQLWDGALRNASIHLDSGECAELAGRFRLGPAAIRDAVSTVCDQIAMMPSGATCDATSLYAAARSQSSERLGTLASKVVSRHAWDELVLPAETFARLRELGAAIKYRHVVYDHWNFAQRVSTGIGVKALFAGASGTGKTMAAGIIARELGLDLYRIDLSGLVSKYIGETEKNLDRIFSAARNSNAVLFFDEADAVFGKRSEVKDAHDRYANVEVAYLLQKLEDHDGVVILASNFKRNIDDAFARRLHYTIDFQAPTAVARERLWRGMFPEAAPLAPDVDFAFLARRFELAGGDIRNVALDAAFLAAQSHDSIGMPHLVRALARQLAKQGKSPSLADFERYYPFIDERYENIVATAGMPIP